MELKELVGEHVLDAVDFSSEKVEIWGYQYEDCQVVRFRLDGKVFTVAEDPEDGYRSSMKYIIVTEEPISNVFAPISVIGRHSAEGEYGQQDDVLELVDVLTGLVVLEVGTMDTDDYYPRFVASFHPEAMVTNRLS